MKNIERTNRDIENNNNKTTFVFIALFLSIFVFDNMMRELLLNSFPIFINRYNFLASLLILTILINYSSRRMHVYWVYVLVILFLFLINILVRGFLQNEIAIVFFSYVSPMLLLVIYDKKINYIELFKKIYKIYYILILTILVFAIIDFLLNRKLQFAFLLITANSDMARLVVSDALSGTYRAFTFIGHPLITASYFIIYFAFSIIYKAVVDIKIGKIKVFSITFLGLLLANSKAAIFSALLLSLLYIANGKRKLYKFSLISIMISLLFLSSLFQNNLLKRFEESYYAGDITNGRISSMEALFTSNVEMPNFFIGFGFNFSREISKYIQTINFENPFLMFAYDYGVLFTIMLVILLVFLPFFQLLKRKKIYEASIIGLVFIHLSTFNALSSGGDLFAAYCFFLMIVRNILLQKP